MNDEAENMVLVCGHVVSPCDCQLVAESIPGQTTLIRPSPPLPPSTQLILAAIALGVLPPSLVGAPREPEPRRLPPFPSGAPPASQSPEARARRRRRAKRKHPHW